MTSTGGGAGRRTDRFSDGVKPIHLRERPRAAGPLLPLYRKTRAGVDYFIGGGAGRACMKDLVVTPRRLPILLQLHRHSPMLGHQPLQLSDLGSALHVMLFFENLIRALLIFNGL